MSGEGISILIAAIILGAAVAFWLFCRYDASGRNYSQILKWTGDKRFARLATMRHYFYENYSVKVFARFKDGKTSEYASLEVFIGCFNSLVRHREKVDSRLIPVYWEIMINYGEDTYFSICRDCEPQKGSNWRAEKISDGFSYLELSDRNLKGEPIKIHAGSSYAQAQTALFIASSYNDLTAFWKQRIFELACAQIPQGQEITDLDPSAQEMFSIIKEACSNKPIQIDATDD